MGDVEVSAHSGSNVDSKRKARDKTLSPLERRPRCEGRPILGKHKPLLAAHFIVARLCAVQTLFPGFGHGYWRRLRFLNVVNVGKIRHQAEKGEKEFDHKATPLLKRSTA